MAIPLHVYWHRHGFFLGYVLRSETALFQGTQCFYQFGSVAHSCLTPCDPTDCSTPGFPVHHCLPELAQTDVHQVGMPSNHLILCCPLLLLPSIFPSIRIFSSESALHIRWPKYWSFCISLSSEYSGLISFRIDWYDLLAVQGLLRVFSSTIRKHQFFGGQPSLWSNSHICT